jgi:hypothetical protein
MKVLAWSVGFQTFDKLMTELAKPSSSIKTKVLSVGTSETTLCIFGCRLHAAFRATTNPPRMLYCRHCC